MQGQIEILTVTRDGCDGIVVEFSDGTTGAYVVEELLELGPNREWPKLGPESASAHARLTSASADMK